MSIFDLARIRTKCGLNHIEFHPTVESTSTLAQELCEPLAELTPALVLAESQTAGRGRGSHRWWASEGALTFTLVIDCRSTGLQPERQAIISLAVGAAVRRVIAEETVSDCKIKWPNDIYLTDRKVCGILTEQKTVNGHPTALIGVGINVNNSLAIAPKDFSSRATSLFDVTGNSFPLSDLLIRTLNAIQTEIGRLAQEHQSVIQEINAHNLLLNAIVEIRSGDRSTTGRCTGISHSGALQLQTANGLTDVISGSVVKYELPPSF